jgi:uncharacterized protein YacL
LKDACIANIYLSVSPKYRARLAGRHCVESTMRESRVKTILKYFVHGLFFNLFITLEITGLLSLGTLLIILGGLVGLIATIAAMMVLFGVANNLINRTIWKEEMDWSIPALLVHGLGLFVALLIVNAVIDLLPLLFFPGVITTIVLFIPTCILDGRICRSIAERWID